MIPVGTENSNCAKSTSTNHTNITISEIPTYVKDVLYHRDIAIKPHRVYFYSCNGQAINYHPTK